MTTAQVGTSGVGNQSANAAAKLNDTSQLADKDTFLQLLVAQIKNQNPLSPTDGVQFLSQLAQFTQVEQSTQMRDELKAIHELLVAQAATAKATDSATRTDGTAGNK
jgi:flagellar basal-body rod modification protein FlgD